MAVLPTTHPSHDTLQAFGQGKLDDGRAEAVIHHLDSCESCCQVVANQWGDSFLKQLRAAQGGKSGTAASRSGVERNSQTFNTPAPTIIHGLPPELANHEQYEVLRELGRGGMGVVYLARNKMMDRLEVLKVMNKALVDHPGAADRFLREIRSAARLSHKNVVSAYSALHVGDLIVLTMEYVDGEDLTKVVKSNGPLPIPNACYYIQQAALGLQHAHEKGMVHRDIKPQNLMLSRGGNKHIIKILDFGLAKASHEGQVDTELTGTGRMLGTPDYVAPEQIVDASRADIRADIYSLGCTLYYLLTGAPPFKGKNLYEVLQAHQTGKVRFVRVVRPEVPPALAQIVTKAMAKAPGHRFQQPIDIFQALLPFVKTPAAVTHQTLKPAQTRAAQRAHHNCRQLWSISHPANWKRTARH